MSRLHHFAKIATALALTVAGTAAATAQTSPGLRQGQVPTAAQWNSYFSSKQDVLGFTALNSAGGFMFGPLITSASATTGSGLRLPPGADPTSPVNGDLWVTSTGIFARVNDITIQLGDNTSVTPGSYGDSSHVGAFTVNARGKITAASNIAITPAAIAAVPTTRTISTATGLSGGGDLSANRTIGYDIPSLTTEGSVDPLTTFALCETAGVTKKCTAGSIAAAATAGVSSLGGATGGISLSSGLSMVGTTLTSVWNKSGSDINYTAGNVGIGTATPTLPLHVQKDQNNNTYIASRNDTSGTAASAGFLAEYGNASQYLQMLQFSPTTATTGLITANSAAILSGFNANGLRVFTLDSTALTLGTANTARMTIAAAGNVGIGTASPAQLLEVSAASDPVIQVTNTGLAGSIQMGVNAGNNAVLFQATNALDIKFFNGQYPLTMKGSNGYLGVLNLTPTAAIDVVNSVNDFAQGIRILNSNGGASATAAFLADTGTNQGVFGVRGTGTSTAGILTPSILEIVSVTNGIAIGTISGPIKFSANGSLSEDMRIHTNGKVGILSTTPVALLSVGSLGSVASTNSGTGFILAGTTTLGASLNDVNYVGEFRNTTVNQSRLMVMGYRRVADGSYPGASWRLQNAVDNSFTAYNAGLSYIEFANSAALYFGILGADAMTINSNGVGIGRAPSSGYALDVTGAIRSDFGYFKNGQPWADVKAWGACGCSSGDDSPAIQAAVDYMRVNYAGGTVFFPPGDYRVSTTITVTPGIVLLGSGQAVTQLNSTNAHDIRVLDFTGAGGSGNEFNSIDELAILGSQSTSATTIGVVGVVGVVNMRNCRIWGGAWALNTNGTDGMILNCFIQGTGSSGGNVVSGGSNWYIRTKLDDNGQSHLYGFWQQWSGSGAFSENHFMQTDITGNFSAAAIRVDDSGHHNNIVVFAGGVLSPAAGVPAAHIDSAAFVSFVGTEVGGNVVGSSVPATSISGSYGFTGITATGATCAANIQITC